MCGIAGFVGRGTIADLLAMVRALAHRGPDAEGIWLEEKKGIYLGHRRLSILDLSGGAQPMWTGDGALGIIFNGEIYNHGELREQLKQAGHRFLTDHADTEVLLHGYRQWGSDLLARLNGMWAFAIYDATRQELFLSRDRFGKKPLFYTLYNGTFAFASELSALVKHSQLRPTVAPLSLKKYFAYGFIPAPRSLYQGIYKLPGGCNLLLNLADLQYRVTRYWDFVLEPYENLPAHAEEEWAEQIRHLLARAVQCRMVADVPVGIFLSGGIDSSAIAALAQKTSAGPVQSFSIGFREATFDESAYSLRAAKFLGTEHHQQTLSLELAQSLLPEIAQRIDEPLGDSSVLPTFLLCRETRQAVTVALGGDGADELFAGYAPFHALAMAKAYNALVPKPLHLAILLLAMRLPTSNRYLSLDFKIKRFLRGLSYPRALWNAIWLGPLDPGELAELFAEPISLEEVYSEALEQWEANRPANLVDQTLQFYTRLYLQESILVKLDRASMMHSLEVRSPYLDRDLVDLVRRIPHVYKYRRGQTKYILKRALAPILPREILHRPKRGFAVPIGQWFHDGDLPFAQDSDSFLQQRLTQHRQGQADHRLYLWNQWLLDHYLAQTARVNSSGSASK